MPASMLIMEAVIVTKCLFEAQIDHEAEDRHFSHHQF